MKSELKVRMAAKRNFSENTGKAKRRRKADVLGELLKLHKNVCVKVEGSDLPTLPGTASAPVDGPLADAHGTPEPGIPDVLGAVPDDTVPCDTQEQARVLFSKANAIGSDIDSDELLFDVD